MIDVEIEVELECAHCGDLIEVLDTREGTRVCPSCGETLDAAEPSGVSEPIERRVTGRFRRLPRRAL